MTFAHTLWTQNLAKITLSNRVPKICLLHSMQKFKMDIKNGGRMLLKKKKKKWADAFEHYFLCMHVFSKVEGCREYVGSATFFVTR